MDTVQICLLTVVVRGFHQQVAAYLSSTLHSSIGKDLIQTRNAAILRCLHPDWLYKTVLTLFKDMIDVVKNDEDGTFSLKYRV